ncbi:MAG: hypothetical protein CBC16_06395, partial [Verrucomicrobia bacterium TMED56]
MSLAVIGATSAVAIETAKVFAGAGHDLFLISRDTSGLSEGLGLSSKRNVAVRTLNADVSLVDDLPRISREIVASLDNDPYVMFAVGALFVETPASERDSHFLEVIDVNFRHVALIMETV